MIKIDSDKILNINGSRIFPVYIYSICNGDYENSGIVGPCNPTNNTNFLFSGGGSNIYETTDHKTLFEQVGIYYCLSGLDINIIPQNLIDSKYFFGYYQIDEPDGTSPGQTITDVSNTYNAIKVRDPFHPVILDNWQNMMTWAPYCEIITWDIYPIYQNLISYSREDIIYAYEYFSNKYFFTSGNDVNSISKPVYAVIQANGVPFGGLDVPTPKEARSLTYVPITMDVKGIGYWSYEGYGGPDTSGLYKNPTLYSYYQQLANEIKSFNDWLITPTIDYSWQYHTGTKVTFNKVLTKTVINKQFTNFNYILKMQGNIYFLIVINKDSRPLSNVTINIKGIICRMIITTLGLEIQGSGKSGRNIYGNEGKFVDSFDGFAVHIYKIRCRYY